MQLNAAKSDVDQLKKKVDGQAMNLAAKENTMQSKQYVRFKIFFRRKLRRRF